VACITPSNPVFSLRHFVFFMAISWIVWLSLSLSVHAQSTTTPQSPAVANQTETWMGAQIAARSWSVYSGTTLAPFGSIQNDGWRLRAVGGYGQYRYDGTVLSGNQRVATRFEGTQGFGELLVGYQWRRGPLTLKGFVGGAGVGHVISPFDPDNPTTGTHYGVAGALEAWYNLSDTAWLSANIGLSSVFNAAKADVRLGYRLTQNLDLGIEGAVMHDDTYGSRRVGAFAQYRWGRTELRASAGVTSDTEENSGIFGAFNLLFAY
jgi:Cellulose biosynthesis protein BcsS